METGALGSLDVETLPVISIILKRGTPIGLLHPTGANDVLSYPLWKGFLSFFLSKERGEEGEGELIGPVGNRRQSCVPLSRARAPSNSAWM